MRYRHCLVFAAFLGLLASSDVSYAQAHALLSREVGEHRVVGYKDTPKLDSTDGRYVVHDPDRPTPAHVIVDAEAMRIGSATAPSDAIVLFDGSDLSQWQGGEWTVADGAMIAGHGNISTKQAFGDYQLHIEWKAPKDPGERMMNRGNSGVFFMGLYELQIFDSHPVHEVQIYADGQAASIYGQTPPLVNACLPPGCWQTFDVVFKAPVFEGDQLVEPARITVFHNGLLVHHDQEIYGPTNHCLVTPYSPHAAKLPLMLQGHGSPVAFRNIWVRELDD